MDKVKQYLIMFLIGAAGYSIIEIIWRGYTHWTMFLTGGICFVMIYYICGKYWHKTLVQKCIISAFIITCTELTVGCIANIIFNMDVWDYSRQPLNLYGQICALYSLLWFLLCMPLVRICSLVHIVFDKEK